jgi:hypothetical protein
VVGIARYELKKMAMDCWSQRFPLRMKAALATEAHPLECTDLRSIDARSEGVILHEKRDASVTVDIGHDVVPLLRG